MLQTTFVSSTSSSVPVGSSSFPAQGTLSDNFVFVCEHTDGVPWALVVFVKASDQLASALVPVMDVPEAAARFVAFLRSDGGPVRVRSCRFEDEHWKCADQTQTFLWPKAN